MNQLIKHRIPSLWIFLFILLINPFCGFSQHIQVNLENKENNKVKDSTYINQLIKNSDKENQDHPDSALNQLQEAFNLSLPIHFTNGILNSLIKKGNIYREMSLNKEALNAYKKALAYCDSLKGTQKYLASIYSNLGTFYSRTGNLNKALNFYFKAIRCAEQYPSLFSKEEINLNISIVYERMGQTKLAFQYLDKIEKKLRQKDDPAILMSLLNNKGLLYLDTKKDDSAAFTFKEILNISQPNSNSTRVLMALNNLGDIYNRKKQPALALSYLKEAQRRDNHKDPYISSGIMMSLGELYFSQKKYDLASQVIKQVIPQAKLLHIPDLEMAAHHTLSEIYEQMNQNALALQHYKKYENLKDRISGKEVAINMNQLEVKYKTAEMDKSILNKQLLITQQQKSLNQKTAWIIGISLFTLVIIILSFIIHRNYKHKQSTRFQKLEIDYLQNVMQAEEGERKRIARELHDGIGGLLGAVSMNLSALKKANPDFKDHQKLIEIDVMLREAAADVRKTAHNLTPDILIKNKLQEALTKYCNRITDNSDLLLELQLNLKDGDLKQTIELMIFRIIQELIQNILKHANATNASIQIMNIDKKLSILVEDNGIGFDTEQKQSGIGLQNLAARIKPFSGDLSITSSIGKGTIVHIQFDWNELKQKTII